MSDMSPHRTPRTDQPQSAMQSEITAALAPLLKHATDAIISTIMSELNSQKSPDPKYISTADAAKLLCVTEQTIRRRLKHKEITGTKIGNRIMIDREALVTDQKRQSAHNVTPTRSPV